MMTIGATETIPALEDLLRQSRPTAEGPLEGLLTLAHLTGEDRALTTAIATALRDEVTLDDGTLPLGIRFLSKHGHRSEERRVGKEGRGGWAGYCGNINGASVVSLVPGLRASILTIRAP